MRPKSGWLALYVLLASLVLVLPGAAQEPTPTDDQVNAIARQLYCPVCENVPLDVCPTQACIQWRATIRRMLAEGRSEEEIKQFFVLQYGARVLATPPASGLNLMVYFVPPVVILVGGIVLVRVMRIWRGAAATPMAEPASGVDDPYVARLEEELRRRT